MRRLGAFALVASMLVAGGIAPALAQEEAPAEEGPITVSLPIDDVDTSRYPAVTVTVTVPVELATDTFVLSDFFVTENDQSRAVVVQQVQRDELAVVFALDTSGSMRGEPLVEAKQAIASFVEVMPPGVLFALVRFGTTSELVVPFTTDAQEIQDAVAGLVAGGETALYDGLSEASGLFEELTGVRRSLILLSDGGDTASIGTLEESIVALLQSESEFVAVELQSPENDPAPLQRLRVASQGTVVAATNPETLQGIFGTLASDLLNQFRITFAAQGGGLTELSVAVRGENVIAVSTSSVRFPDLPPQPVTTTPPTTVAPVTPTPTTIAPAVAIEPLTGTTIDLPWYRTSTGLMWGGIAMFIGLFGLIALVRPAKVSGGVAAMRGLGRGRQRGRTVLGHMADRATLFAEEALTRRDGGRGLRLLLDQAGLNLRVGEFAVIVLAALLLGFLIGSLWLGLFGGLVGGALGVVASFSVVSALASVRAKRFRTQLADTLQLIAGGLRAGFGVNQAIDGVIAEAPEPTSAEFARVGLEVQLGRELEEALATMAERVRSEDLRMAAEAIEIHRQVGGDLAELLERVAATIREREMVRRQIHVLSAEGRISAFVLIGLPIFIAIVVRSIAPDYFAELTSSGAGKVMIVVGLALLGIGIVWIQRIVKLRF